jgi:hypothetical protein
MDMILVSICHIYCKLLNLPPSFRMHLMVEVVEDGIGEKT